MKSVVNMVGVESKNRKSLNFILVGYGQCDLVQAFLKYVNKQISAHILALPVTLYNQRTLDLAEAKPELLRNGTQMPLRITRGTANKEYIGFLNNVDRDKLYKYLYATPADLSGTFQRPPLYSQNNLTRVINEKLGTTESDTDGLLGDLEVRFNQDFCGQGKLYVRIEYKISEMLIKSFPYHVNWFRCFVEEMDVQFPDALKTAYISFNSPQMPLVHERVYDSYNIRLVESKALGTEWYGYFNKSIAEHIGLSAYQELAELTQITQMQNGISYVATKDIVLFDAALRKKISYILKDILMPAFGVYDWSRLCRQQWRVNYLPQNVVVYHDAYTPGDPTVVFSFNYDTDQLIELKGLSPRNKEVILLSLYKPK